MIRIELERVEGEYGFKASDANGNFINTDTNPENGGTNFGVRPMQAVLMAMGGCSAIDIVSILKKQKQNIESFKISIDGERETGKEPALWKKVHVHFQLGGPLDHEKVKRACTLSIDKYCSVAETLRRAGAEITWEVTVNNSK